MSVLRAILLVAAALLLAAAAQSEARRIWIDSDAACDGAARHDPDDCLAVYALAASGEIRIVGVSSVFGNVGETESRETLHGMATALAGDGIAFPNAFPGAGKPFHRQAPPAESEAQLALCQALDEAPLTVVALGPLTNIAAAMTACPDLTGQIERIVFVGGRREGHVFHPAEDAMPRARLGHGPIFRDLNVELDRDAASQVLTSGVALTLGPYELARKLELTGADLDAFAERGAAADDIAANSRNWLAWWQADVGREGFYPFDLMAAAVILTPEAFVCVTSHASVRRDAMISLFGNLRVLLFALPPDGTATRPIETCLTFSHNGRELVRQLITGSQEESAT